MIEIIQGLPDNVIGIVYRGGVTGKDYDDVLIPVINDKLKRHKKIRLLYQINTGMSDFAPSSYLEDAKVSWHVFSFEKMAIVSDGKWVDESVKFFAFLMPMPIKVFSNNEIERAKEWISE